MIYITCIVCFRKVKLVEFNVQFLCIICNNSGLNINIKQAFQLYFGDMW